MLGAVTIAARRTIYWILFALALGAFSGGLVAAIGSFSGGSDSSFLTDSGALSEGRFLGFRFSSPMGAVFGALLAALMGVGLLVSILSTFRKTTSAEIFFFGFWALSLALEVGRVFVFALGSKAAADHTIANASRLVMTGRYLGDLALLLSGLFAVGLRSEQPGSFAVGLVAIGAAFASAVPLDTGVYEASLILRPGYRGIDQAIGLLAAFITLANYLRAGRVTGEKGYLVAGFGVLLAMVGRVALEVSWHPFPILGGGILIGIGSFLLISRLHAYYLWQ